MPVISDERESQSFLLQLNLSNDKQPQPPIAVLHCRLLTELKSTEMISNRVTEIRVYREIRLFEEARETRGTSVD
jgi:hypothetical protein